MMICTLSERVIVSVERLRECESRSDIAYVAQSLRRL